MACNGNHLRRTSKFKTLGRVQSEGLIATNATELLKPKNFFYKKNIDSLSIYLIIVELDFYQHDKNTCFIINVQ